MKALHKTTKRSLDHCGRITDIPWLPHAPEANRPNQWKKITFHGNQNIDWLPILEQDQFASLHESFLRLAPSLTMTINRLPMESVHRFHRVKGEIAELKSQLEQVQNIIKDLKSKLATDQKSDLDSRFFGVQASFAENQVELDQDFVEVLNDLTLTIGKREPTKRRF